MCRPPRPATTTSWCVPSVPAAGTPFHLRARLIPFGITDVQPASGGAGRYVTLTLTGAKFDPAAIVKIIRPDFAEYEPVSYRVVDATRIIATFDLRDAPYGLYDVQVTNPNGQTSRIRIAGWSR